MTGDPVPGEMSGDVAVRAAIAVLAETTHQAMDRVDAEIRAVFRDTGEWPPYVVDLFRTMAELAQVVEDLERWPTVVVDA